MDEQEYDVSGLDALYAALEARGIRVTEEEADMPMLDETPASGTWSDSLSRGRSAG